MERLERVYAYNLIKECFGFANRIHEEQLRSPEVNLIPCAVSRYSTLLIFEGLNYFNDKCNDPKKGLRLNVYQMIAVSLFTSFSALWIIGSYKKIKLSAWGKDFVHCASSLAVAQLICHFFPQYEVIKRMAAFSLTSSVLNCSDVFLQYQRNSAIPLMPLLVHGVLKGMVANSVLVLVNAKYSRESAEKRAIALFTARIAIFLGSAFLIEKSTGAKVLMSKKWIVFESLGNMMAYLALFSRYSPLTPKN